MSDRPLLERSANTERALRLPRPRLRGRSHLVAFLVALPMSVAWVVGTASGTDRVAVAAFTVGITAMFGCSALLHLRRWSGATYERLFRLDHSGIYLAIGGTGVAIALLGLDGWAGTLLLVGAVAGPAAGVAVEWLPFAPPKGFNSAVYLTFGWLPVALLPWLWATSGAASVGLLLGGGVLYTLGATVVGLRRPDPAPRWFGYHEIFHLFVIAAVVTHAWLVARLAGQVG